MNELKPEPNPVAKSKSRRSSISVDQLKEMRSEFESKKRSSSIMSNPGHMSHRDRLRELKDKPIAENNHEYLDFELEPNLMS